MAFLDWTAELSAGDADLDWQHFVLVDLVNRLHDSMKCSGPKAGVLRIMAELEDFADLHFTCEEAVMRRRGLVELDDLRIECRVLRNQVAALRQRLAEGSLTLSPPVISYLGDWVRGHIRQACEDSTSYCCAGQISIPNQIFRAGRR